MDYTPVFGDAIDLARFGEIGKKGVLALMCDSTNAERPGFTQSEKSVGRYWTASLRITGKTELSLLHLHQM